MFEQKDGTPDKRVSSDHGLGGDLRGLRSWARRVGKLAVEGRTQTDELDVELDPKRFVCRRSLGGET